MPPNEPAAADPGAPHTHTHAHSLFDMSGHVLTPCASPECFLSNLIHHSRAVAGVELKQQLVIKLTPAAEFWERG